MSRFYYKKKKIIFYTDMLTFLYERHFWQHFLCPPLPRTFILHLKPSNFHNKVTYAYMTEGNKKCDTFVCSLSMQF